MTNGNSSRIGDQATVISFPMFCTLGLFAILVGIALRALIWKMTANDSVAVFVRSQPDRSPTSITINISHSCVPSLRLTPCVPSPSSVEKYTGIVESGSAVQTAAQTTETKKTV